MKMNNILLSSVITTAILATTGVTTATAHAADSSTNPGISTEEMAKYFQEHGAQQTNVNVITKVLPNKYGVYVDKRTNEANSPAVVYQFNKYPSQMDTLYQLNSNTPNKNEVYYRAGSDYVYIEGVKIELWKNGQMTVDLGGGVNTSKKEQNQLNEQAKFLETHGMNHLSLKLVTAMSNTNIKLLDNYNVFLNIAKFYRKLLHIDINKIMINKQPSNWKAKYANGATPKGFMKDGYSKAWLNKKLTWIIRNPKAATKEMLKIAKQTTLKDQSRNNDTGKFDNTTIK